MSIHGYRFIDSSTNYASGRHLEFRQQISIPKDRSILEWYQTIANQNKNNKKNKEEIVP
jgi:hypothetical protein